MPRDEWPEGIVGEVLRAIDRLRREKGFNRLEQLAAKAGVGASTWYGWKSGDHKPSLEDVEAFARAAGGMLRVVSQADAQRHMLGALTTVEAVAIATSIADLNDKHREQIRMMVEAQAHLMAEQEAREERLRRESRKRPGT